MQDCILDVDYGRFMTPSAPAQVQLAVGAGLLHGLCRSGDAKGTGGFPSLARSGGSDGPISWPCRNLFLVDAMLAGPRTGEREAGRVVGRGSHRRNRVIARAAHLARRGLALLGLSLAAPFLASRCPQGSGRHSLQLGPRSHRDAVPERQGPNDRRHVSHIPEGTDPHAKACGTGQTCWRYVWSPPADGPAPSFKPIWPLAGAHLPEDADAVPGGVPEFRTR
jgi:hypothetical protein